ncbi:MAG: paraquat-inducible protein A [Rhodospirillaceae bacterium]|jgi:paraquat-inducible protein A|nr:paraquat-inducible protein A [Rhodospirillaceae bacterium]MBT6205799.1 paraquat-inducible protein A [Rhodospirillaceae bacterium]MBT6512661.1 paraquat-inducible protein A [Rhodospirillaceae bacterium]MBT7613906.1 paraquat-inducible protein A [Rhodospirillaceae bacterium]MBT7646300.1 paraquat-inducible protein A [Rhodospirillaceae bacterium]
MIQKPGANRPTSPGLSGNAALGHLCVMANPSHRDALTILLLLAAVVFLALGLFLPAFTVEKFWLFENRKSIAGSVYALLAGKNIVLGFVILIFSIIFPTTKLVLSLWIWASPDPTGRHTRYALKWSVRLGKWSMMDVFMVALVVAMLSLGMVAQVTADYGVYFFCAGILASMFGAHRLERSVEKASRPA